jgi:hypothetical protein
MKKIFILIMLLSFFTISCGKKEAPVTDTKKEPPKTETKQETQTTTPSTGDVKLPADFPLKDEVFKKATVTMASESSGLKTVNFKPDGLPEDIAAVIDKELVKDGFKKSKEDKSDMLKETEWTKDTKKIGLDLQYASGKLLSVSVYYEGMK